jgi:N-(2-amino-2-carboxyethyl)-L-glutamate synthase
MPVITAPEEFNQDDLFIDLRAMTGHSLYLKCEGFNFAGSVKLKAARAMVEAAERDGSLRPGSILVESSSGNLGVALAMIAASRGYEFICVTDSRCNLTTRRLIQALGAQVHLITEPDPTTGLVGARMNHVRALCASDERYVWLNQYNNDNAWKGSRPTEWCSSIRMRLCGSDHAVISCGVATPSCGVGGASRAMVASER